MKVNLTLDMSVEDARLLSRQLQLSPSQVLVAYGRQLDRQLAAEPRFYAHLPCTLLKAGVRK